MTKFRSCLLCILLLILAQQAYSAATLEFTSEDLVFSLYGNVWKLKGDYVFSNYSTDVVTQQIYFPIPVDSTSSGAQDVTLSLVKSLPGQSCKIMSVKPEGFWFELVLPAKTIATCKISYWQQLRGTKAKYILLTANSWGKPLEKAKYTLYVSNKIRVKKLSLPDPVFKQRWFSVRYIWEYSNFSPQTDFIVESKDFFYK